MLDTPSGLNPGPNCPDLMWEQHNLFSSSELLPVLDGPLAYNILNKSPDKPSSSSCADRKTGTEFIFT
jgi:hypothetical protein